MNSSRALILLLLVLLAAPLWGAEPAKANDAAPARGRIVVLGDSLTAGYGLDSPEQAYPALLQKKLNEAGHAYEVVNAGVSGDTTSGGLRRVAWALAKGADILIVALGGNDGLRGIPPKQTAENLAGIIQRAREKAPGIRIILAGMQMPGNMGPEYTEAYRATFPKVATEQKATLLPFLLEGIGGDAKFNQEDLIHPNAEGQKRIAASMWKVLQPLLQQARAEGR